MVEVLHETKDNARIRTSVVYSLGSLRFGTSSRLLLQRSRFHHLYHHPTAALSGSLSRLTLNSRLPSPRHDPRHASRLRCFWVCSAKASITAFVRLAFRFRLHHNWDGSLDNDF